MIVFRNGGKQPTLQFDNDCVLARVSNRDNVLLSKQYLPKQDPKHYGNPKRKIQVTICRNIPTSIRLYRHKMLIKMERKELHTRQKLHARY